MNISNKTRDYYVFVLHYKPWFLSIKQKNGNLAIWFTPLTMIILNTTYFSNHFPNPNPLQTPIPPHTRLHLIWNLKWYTSLFYVCVNLQSCSVKSNFFLLLLEQKSHKIYDLRHWRWRFIILFILLCCSIYHFWYTM